ncbi:MAG: hydantoinase/oxoprolinase, partial [Armatimonadetes bacterium]|nr:hydantoinase/oxoprolinase [Armatimonadota bacterium]
MASYRIGIDVGGTFTHAVALDSHTLSVVAQARVPTTHESERGVAEGVVQALRHLLGDADLSPDQVTFLAYSTTQVTNALLEGDVAGVGIVAVGSGLEGRRAAKETRVGNLQLAPGKELHTSHVFLDASEFDEAAVDAAIEKSRLDGAEAIVAAEAFSVDDPRREQMIMARAVQTGLPATATHEITGRYGLRMRTRTAVINASLLPRAISTANLTEEAAREIGITAPLMVVRSDGGVMSVEDMRRRPLLTLLSGPAAGVAAALMYARVSEGVFLEVGGTSTDISAICHGRALLRTAEVGGHRLFLRTVDVHTVGVAGGSMPRLRDGHLHAVGPRSAHLAGLPYACFSELD